MLLVLLTLVLLVLLAPGSLASDAKVETPPIIIDACMEDAPMQTELPMANRASVGGPSVIACADVNNAPANRSLPPAAPSGNGDLSPRAASLLNEHLIALLGKEWTSRVDDQDQSDWPGERGPVSLWAYRAGLMKEWRQQIFGAEDTLDIDYSWNPPRIQYQSGRYFRVSSYHDPGYRAGQNDARELVRVWVNAIESEVARNREAILEHSTEDRIDYSMTPQLEALRYLRRKLHRRGFGAASSSDPRTR